MSKLSRRALVFGLSTALLLMGALIGGREAEAGKWNDLTGRMAPDLGFADAAQGLAPGTRLSSFRRKQVVVLVFWLRDCPHCKRELPKVQRLHALYGNSGLRVVSVVHKFPLSQIVPTMRKRGWTFPVARDATGSMAGLYGGGGRPGIYLIGIDGRVKTSSGLSERRIQSELGRWRLNELGAFPEALRKARDHVFAGDYGSALRSAEGAVASGTATPEVRAAVARLKQIAGRKLQNRQARAERWSAAGNNKRAEQEYRGMVTTFKGTSLEARATALFERFKARVGR